ncbi:unnamed protein product [Moneuplotes crassus]|uniref:Peptidase A1 domain-containing protein n=2 Tax=Euplotes crassus TaxID=5936 RepID=A0AAD1U7S2_EUPCR|nr:unnamed protein product [Moneuplotes crassus]
MLKFLALFAILGAISAQEAIKTTMTKEYKVPEKILDGEGNWVDNPDFENFTHLHDVHNEQNLIYYGNVYFWKDGSDKPDMLQVIMDTGSSWLWAPSSICNGCPSDDSLEHSYLINNGEGIKSITYGSGSIHGDIVRGVVSLENSKSRAIHNYKMLEVTSANLPGLEGSNWDGILGLLPTGMSGSDLFVTQLYKEGLIPEDSFGVKYTDTSEGSEITFGGFDKSIVEELDDFTFIDLFDDMHWSASLEHAKYGPYGNLPTDEIKSAILDSGTSLILMPTSLFKAFQKTILKEKKTCGLLSGYFGCYCQDKYDFQPLFFRLENYEYRVSQENYIVETWNKRKKFCYFLVQGSDFKKGSMILGDSFLRNYYVYHDVTNKRVGLYGDYMMYYRTKVFTPVFLTILAIAGGTLLCCICCLYYCCICKKSDDQEKEPLISDIEQKSDADPYAPQIDEPEDVDPDKDKIFDPVAPVPTKIDDNAKDDPVAPKKFIKAKTVVEKDEQSDLEEDENIKKQITLNIKKKDLDGKQKKDEPEANPEEESKKPDQEEQVKEGEGDQKEAEGEQKEQEDKKEADQKEEAEGEENKQDE